MQSSDITCNAAEEKDGALIFDQAKQLIDKYESLEEIDYDKVLAWYRRKIQQHIQEYTRITVDGLLAGFYRFSSAGDKMEIDDLYILPAFQNRGIGTAVIETCLAQAELPVFLYVFQKNTGALRLYQRMGFVITKAIGTGRYVMEHE